MRVSMIVVWALLVMTAVSCNNGISNTKVSNESGRNDRNNKSRRTVIDAGAYTDLTSGKVNANTVKKEDILYKSFGTFRIENGNSEITISRIDGTITLTSDNARYQGKDGQQMYARFRFEAAAANSNCLYIKMGKKDGAVLLIGNNKYNGAQVPDLIVCVPLYGFGENRIAVSSIMDGYIGMPSGTYWKK